MSRAATLIALNGVLAMSAIATPASAQLPARWPRAPLTEVARAAVGADVAWERYGLTGRGAVLCLIDTGVDVRHADLARDGEPRVRWVVDVLAAPRGGSAPLEARVGAALYRGDEPEVPGDPHGHGTAMAGIAVGGAGLAPGAEVIAVRAYDPRLRGFPDDAVARGVAACRTIADADDAMDARRMVVLLSLGGHDGGHDGRGAFERALMAHARAVPIVVAAGNDGERAVRATGRLFQGEEGVVTIQVPRSARADAELAITLRTDGAASLDGPDGGSVSWTSPGELALPGARVVVEPIEGEIGVVRVRLGARDGALASGTYRLRIAGPARFEVWLAGARLGATFFTPSLGGAHVVSEEAITIPATAETLIAVGATVSRAEVRAELGPLTLPGMVGGRAGFSSIGPTPSGTPKPDLSAPGGWLLTTLSSDVEDGDADNLVGGALARYREGGRIAVRGTSASAAVVAGALLLAMELAPRQPEEARALVIASARGAAWSPELGAGVLDVERLLAMWSRGRGQDDADAVTVTRAFVPSDELLWLSARVRGERLTVVHDGASHVVPLRFGTGQLALAVPRATVGTPLVLEPYVDGAPLAPVHVPVVIERGPRGAIELAGGGCSVGGRGAGGAVAMLVAVLALRWRRRALS